MFAASFLSGALALGVGCAAGTKSPSSANEPTAAAGQAQTPTPQAAKPKHITPDELKKLRWIEGAWRGTGDVEAPFFERYRFENDSVLAVESFKDETHREVADVTRFELRDGEFGNGGEGSRWAATTLDEQSVTFEPIAKARNSFRWQRESADVWKAVLDYPATENKPARRRVYRMERLPAPRP